jgi:DNA-binding CsgD family transcriptional regulator
MQGYTNHEIAGKLFISYETVKSHRKHILLKTGAKNTAALINYYHQTFFDK